MTSESYLMLPIFRTCHVCDVCTSGLYNACQISPTVNTVGIMRDGAFAQFCKVPADQVYKLPSDISLKQGKLNHRLLLVYKLKGSCLLELYMFSLICLNNIFLFQYYRCPVRAHVMRGPLLGPPQPYRHGLHHPHQRRRHHRQPVRRLGLPPGPPQNHHVRAQRRPPGHHQQAQYVIKLSRACTCISNKSL